jgi:hypothetical protein
MPSLHDYDAVPLPQYDNVVSFELHCRSFDRYLIVVRCYSSFDFLSFAFSFSFSFKFTIGHVAPALRRRTIERRRALRRRARRPIEQSVN